MAVLRPHIVRLAAYSTVLALSIHFATLLLLPVESPAASFIQVSIAAVCLGALIGIVMADFQRGGSLMRRIEEELLVIAIFGLFWLSFATILRVHGRSEGGLGGMNVAQSSKTGQSTSSSQQYQKQQQQQQQQQRRHNLRLHPKVQPTAVQLQRPQQTPVMVVPTPQVTTAAEVKATPEAVEAKRRRSYVFVEEWVYGDAQYGNGQ